jgi:hypothetical protein
MGHRVPSEPAEIERLAQHIAQFTLAGIRARVDAAKSAANAAAGSEPKSAAKRSQPS